MHRTLRPVRLAVPLLLVVLVAAGAASAADRAPSASTAAERIYVMTNAGYSSPKVKPRSMHILSNENLGKLKWSSWGRKTAYARGTDYAGGPSPGHDAQNPVNVRLYGIEDCDGILLYTKMKITFTKGRPYSGSPRTEKYPMGCPEG